MLLEFSVIFEDFVSENENDYKYLYCLVKNDILKGYDDGTVRQNSNLTRAEAATVFSRFLKVIN